MLCRDRVLHKMMGCKPVAVLVCCLVMVWATSVDNRANTGTIQHMDILMRGAKPLQPDAYLCTSYEVEEDEAYVVKFEALANADTAHHILMYGCEHGAYTSKDVWSCPPMCRGGPQQIMFAWAKNAPPTQLPDGVGLRIGKRTSIRTVVMQIHYAKSFQANESPDSSGIRLHITQDRQPYVAGIYLMLSYNFAVPPNRPKYHVDISCSYNQRHSMFPFAYRTHAHGLGRVITGYQYNSTGYHMIGKGNPQWPQAFYPANTSIEVKPGDKLAARCTYNSTGVDHNVRVGATGIDEMCNFYIMFYTDSSVAQPSGQCAGVAFPNLVNNMPADSDVTLPPNPLLDEQAHGHHHHHHGMPQASHTDVEHIDEPSGPVEPFSGTLEYQMYWPGNELELGQVSGVATDHDGNFYIFHRANRVWDRSSFDFADNFLMKDQPIMHDTVVILAPDGQVIRKFGSGKFYMPHGIEVDHEGNIWLTDVALHQVFKIPAGGSEPELTLGEAFIHGNDARHFCKPSDVAILPSGEFFVSDGYCNARILKFSKDGHLLKTWGRSNAFGSLEPGPGQFFIPHSLAVASAFSLLCVADRENGRIQCFDLEGTFKFFIKLPQFGSSLYAIEYSPRHGGLLYAVNGAGPATTTIEGFTISLRNHSLLETWNMPLPERLGRPHDIAVDPKANAVYVGELDPHAVHKFQRRAPSDTFPTPKPTTTTTTTSSAPKEAEGAREPVPLQTGKKNNIEPVQQEISGNSDTRPGRVVVKEDEKKEVVTSFFDPIILVGVFLVIPVIVLLIFALVVYYKGWMCCDRSQTPKGLKMPQFWGNSHKGFDRLLQDDSDLTDSDNEEFMRPVKR